jgi:hypothetical protein
MENIESGQAHRAGVAVESRLFSARFFTGTETYAVKYL